MERRHAELSLRAGALRLLDKVLVEERDPASDPAVHLPS
jgi:hypothetical protein